ncbi:glycosyltransferase [Microbacterium sp. NPDC056044]|uniref:glycosyltransferase n=1 Tax=Microbacterium sp. NPDC056044 TaxID=3345690 RepID=UPI0035DA5786
MTAHETRDNTTLIATVLDEERSLPAFLASLESQTVHPAEIVVVDGGSSDQTVDRLRAWTPACGCRVIVHAAPGAGISAGRNLAITLATNEQMVVTDAGTAQRSDWFAMLTAPWEHDPDAVIAGFFEPAGDSFWSRTIAAVITPTREEIDPKTFQPSSRSVAFPRGVWREVGGYPEWLDYCEDLVFDLAIRETGRQFTFAPDAIVAWVGRPNLRAFAKQYYRYARGDGKAGLFPGRHRLRYGAYAFALIAWWISPWLFLVGAIGFAAYVRTPVRRVWERRRMFGRPATAGALLAAPLVVVVGDVAKMAGYPPGVVWRRRRARGVR